MGGGKISELSEMGEIIIIIIIIIIIPIQLPYDTVLHSKPPTFVGGGWGWVGGTNNTIVTVVTRTAYSHFLTAGVAQRESVVKDRRSDLRATDRIWQAFCCVRQHGWGPRQKTFLVADFEELRAQPHVFGQTPQKVVYSFNVNRASEKPHGFPSSTSL